MGLLFVASMQMNGQPDGVKAGRRPFNPVSGMRGNQQIIASIQMKGLTVFFVKERCLSLKQYYPFIPILIVPLSCRRHMALGNNAFNLDIVALEKAFKQFLRQLIRYVFKKVGINGSHPVFESIEGNSRAKWYCIVVALGT